MFLKAIQNEWLIRVQKYILECINEELIKSLFYNDKKTPYFGVVADEVTDCASWEQLGIVITNKPVDRLIEYVKCDNMRGETIAKLLIESLKSSGIDI